MGQKNRLKQGAFILLVLVVAHSVYTMGWPVGTRMEEYLAFMAEADLEHRSLVETQAVFSQWREGLTWQGAVRSVSARLRSVFDTAPTSLDAEREAPGQSGL